MATVRIKVLFFGMIRDVVGVREDSLELASGTSLGQVFEQYAARFPRLKEMSASTVLALNQQFSTPAALVNDGDEVAFLPPVSGGSSPLLSEYSHQITDASGNFYAITRQPIDGTKIARQILRAEDGAFVNFEGVTRNNSKGRATRYLEYECYEPMAVKMMAQIGAEIAANHEIGRIAMVHRLGRLEISETSVAVVVTSPHRRAAFDAALEGINRLKKLVPVWKKEYFIDGEVWVEGEWDDSIVKARS
jgi:MoaE-MoaD fusion protein